VSDSLVQVTLNYESKVKNKLTGNIQFEIENKSKDVITIELKDNAYKSAGQTKTMAAGSKISLTLDLSASHQWYDASILIKGNINFENRFAGRVETGNEGMSDPAMG
jgi:phospholipase C